MLVKRKLITKECVYERINWKNGVGVCLNCKYNEISKCVKFPSNVFIGFCGIQYILIIARKDKVYIKDKIGSLDYAYRAI